jgi:hypothetical protein
MILSILRVLVGFVLTCLAAGATQVAFAVGPQAIFPTGEDRRILEWILLTATHSAVFAAPFALIAASIGEWQGVRSVFYYAAAGIAIALAGFAAQYQSELPGQASIINTYAFATYATTGLVAGLAYWLTSGRYAGDGPRPANSADSQTA